ncbi:MAG: single-stranded-DNA-specific exonuclease RecJ [Clostridiaceae bacterium]|jgi:single-stranded-DNA-specific exonuclease|nr:single-stranded-DNA-specific exonuclease RecJ [Clostridiaceae bacterium]
MRREITRQELLNWLLPVPWELVEDPAVDPAGLSVPDRILRARGFDTPQKQKQFFEASLDDLPDPFLFRDMEEACRLIENHLRAGAPRLLIFGDYDADGLTAAAILSRYFTGLGHPPQVLIPDRFDDGYGLSPALVDEIELHRPDLVITVDTGTSSPDLVEDLLERGIDVIVTDHHQATGDFHCPKAPLINPTLQGEAYPFPYLSGAGVALMLTLALDRQMDRLPDHRPSLFVLASVGTVADVMPLVEANRILVRHGLDFFETHAPEGLKALKRLSPGDQALTARDIAFSLAPRLNAAGRMGDVRLALDLLLEDDPSRADQLARKLDALNQERRLVEQEIFSQAFDQVLTVCGTDPVSVAIAVGKDWHAGVMGIVSSRLAEKLRVPAITLNEEDGWLTGSARSYGSIDLIKAIRASAPLLEKYGGHAGAAGLTLHAGNLEAFCQQMTRSIEAIPRHIRHQPYQADVVLTGSELDNDLVRGFDIFEPTGSGFERPLVWLSDLTIEGMQRVGEGRHLKFTLRTSDPSMRLFEALLFGRGQEDHFYAIGDTVEILGVPELNRWRDRETVQVRLVEIRPGRHDQINRQAVDGFARLNGQASQAISDMEGGSDLRLSQSLFGSLWQLLESLCDAGGAGLAFLPVRLAWLLSHRYNGKTDPLGLLLAMAIFEQAGLIRLENEGDGSFICSRLERGGSRPALSESPLWTELKELGVIVG